MSQEEKRKLGKAIRHSLRLKCLDCGRFRYVRRHELTRAARVRCLHCGGPMEMSDTGQEKIAHAQDVANEHKSRNHRAQGDPRFWRGQTAQEAAATPLDRLQAQHGTPEEFEAAIWKAFGNKEITAGAAMARISQYRKQWVAAGDQIRKENQGAGSIDPGTICASFLEEDGKYAVLVHVDGGRHISQTDFNYKTLDEARAASTAILDRGMIVAKLLGLKLKRFDG